MIVCMEYDNDWEDLSFLLALIQTQILRFQKILHFKKILKRKKKSLTWNHLNRR